ncbi:MAG: hypothetical protein ABI597_04295 [Gammaproteobacteria bacterium]
MKFYLLMLTLITSTASWATIQTSSCPDLTTVKNIVTDMQASNSSSTTKTIDKNNWSVQVLAINDSPYYFVESAPETRLNNVVVNDLQFVDASLHFLWLIEYRSGSIQCSYKSNNKDIVKFGLSKNVHFGVVNELPFTFYPETGPWLTAHSDKGMDNTYDRDYTYICSGVAAEACKFQYE